MLAPDAKRKLMTIGMLGLPLALVKATAWFSQPAGVEAAPVEAVEPPPVVVAPARPKPTEQQLEAAAWLEANADMPLGENPLFYPSAYEEPTETGTPAPVAIGELSVTVDAIMASPRGSVAVVNGRLLREGDGFDEHWTVTRIDSAARTVEFTNEKTGDVERAQVPGADVESRR